MTYLDCGATIHWDALRAVRPSTRFSPRRRPPRISIPRPLEEAVMRFVRSLRLAFAVSLFALLLQTTARAQDAPTLTDEQAATLATLDPKTAGEIVILVERYQTWKGELDKLRQLRD